MSSQEEPLLGSVTYVDIDAHADVSPSDSGKSQTSKKWQYCLFFGLLLSLCMVIAVPLTTNAIIDSQLKLHSVIDSASSLGYPQFVNHTTQSDSFVYFTLFNITNPSDVLDGHKPNLEEVGPFAYKYSQIRSNFSWSSDDQVRYSQHVGVTFDAEETYRRSNGKFSSSDIKVTTVNVIFSGIKAKIGPTLWHFACKFLLWEHDYERLFTTKSVEDLVHGYSVSLDGAFSWVPTPIPISFPGIFPNLKPSEDPEFTLQDTMKVGSSNNDDVFQMTKFQGKSAVKINCPWSESKYPFMGSCKLGDLPCCNPASGAKEVLGWGEAIYEDLWDTDANGIHGTNGEQFKMHLKTSDKLIVFNELSMRAIQFENVNNERVTVKGIDCLRFQPTEDFLQNAITRPANSRYVSLIPIHVHIFYTLCPI
jgi:hypothetical protein